MIKISAFCISSFVLRWFSEQIIPGKRGCPEVSIAIIFLEHAQTLNVISYVVGRIPNGSHRFRSRWLVSDGRSQEGGNGH